jgi:hypothetical protein
VISGLVYIIFLGVLHFLEMTAKDKIIHTRQVMRKSQFSLQGTRTPLPPVKTDQLFRNEMYQETVARIVTDVLILATSSFTVLHTIQVTDNQWSLKINGKQEYLKI